MGLFNPHKGSWGTPDFGITEFLSDTASRINGVQPTRSADGGSQAIISPFSRADQAQVSQSVSRSTNSPSLSSAPLPVNNMFNQNNNNNSPAGQVLGDSTVGGQLKDAAASEDEALLSRLTGEYNNNRSRLESQLGFADKNKQTALDSLSFQEKDLRNRTAQEENRSKLATETAIGEAGATAKNVQRENRNILRALGILSSSAAGEMLGKPMNQFDKERARLVDVGRQRIEQLRDYLDGGINQLNVARQQVENQFGQLVSQIQADLRFNDFQRAQAIKEANAALKSRFAEIDNLTAQISGQVSNAQSKIVQAIQEQAGLALPEAQGQSIIDAGIDPNAQARKQVDIYRPEENDPLLSQV